jgi:hypothetical protein
MFTKNIKSLVSLTKSGVRWIGAPTVSPAESLQGALTKQLQEIKNDATKTDKNSEYVAVIAKAFPNDLKKQLQVVDVNKGDGKVLDGEAIGVRIKLIEAVKDSSSTQYTEMIAELDKIIKLGTQEKSTAVSIKKQLETTKASYEQWVAATKAVVEVQTSNLSREIHFSDKNVSWTGLLSMIKKEQWTNQDPKTALDKLVTKFDQKWWDASREDDKDNELLADLEKSGYLRFSGSTGSLEYGYKVVAALREIQKDWKQYEKVINGTESLDANKFSVPKADEFATWQNDTSKIANFLADVSGDSILSQTNQVSRMWFLGIFGREDMNKKPLSELGAAKLLQDVLTKEWGEFWTKLGVTKPKKIEDMEWARRALFLRVALADGNPDILRDPSLADKVTNRQIKEQTKQLEANNKTRLDEVKKALAEKNKELSPELLDQAGKSLLTAVDVGGLLIGTGVSLEELAKNTKVDTEKPGVFTILSAGKKWEKQLSQNIQWHLGVGGGAWVDSNGAFFAWAWLDGGIKLVVQDNGKLTVAKGNQTLELNVGIGTSILGFTPVGTVELAYRWNDVISALQSSDANTRNFLKGLFKTDDKWNITMVEAGNKSDAIKALVGDDKYGEQDIKMAMGIIDTQLKNNNLSSTEKVVAVQNFIENFARYNEIRNYQTKQGFHLAGVGFGVLAGPAVLAPFARLIGQNIQAGYRVDAEKTKSVADTKAHIELSPDLLAKAPDDEKSLAVLKQRGATITADGRGIDVSKARFADIQIVGDIGKFISEEDPKTHKTAAYYPTYATDRIITIIQTSRDMNGAETYTLILTTIPAQTTVLKPTKIEIPDSLTKAEKEQLTLLIKIGSLPDKLPWDAFPLRKKYPEMEDANENVPLEKLQAVLIKMSKDTKLTKFINVKFFKECAQSTNPTYLRQILGTIIALTSGGPVANQLGLHIGDSKNPTKWSEMNKYLDTPGLINAELAAISKEYGSVGMTEDNLKVLMRFWNDKSDLPITSGTIPANMYAESAYAKYGQNGTAALPSGAHIAGDLQPYTNETIRKALITKLEVPRNLIADGFTKENYKALLEFGTVKVKKSGVEKTYTANKSELHFARSAVTSQRTCFNAVFAITVPTEITSTDNTVKTLSTGSLNIATDTLLTGVTKANELWFGITGSNTKREKWEIVKDGNTLRWDGSKQDWPGADEA